ncbi:MAG: metallophosphoesterase [Deltaproteobacteria bacterium]|nr:metallophosphoesterase [Deltaproteobacteria bacterium]
MPRLLAIGDIHGCFDKFKKLMDAINWKPAEDTLVFMGDYVDRGPDSAGVIEYIIELKRQSGNLICLMGNHEQLFLEYLGGQANQIFFLNGGLDTLASYGGDRHIPDSHIEFLNSLLPYYETDEYIFAHAGLREDLLWIREEFILSDYDHGKRIIFGHTPVAKPLIQENKIGIDTGAVYGGMLSCVDLPGLVFYSV